MSTRYYSPSLHHIATLLLHSPPFYSHFTPFSLPFNPFQQTLFHTLLFSQVLSIFVYLTDVEEDMAALDVWPKTHTHFHFLDGAEQVSSLCYLMVYQVCQSSVHAAAFHYQVIYFFLVFLGMNTNPHLHFLDCAEQKILNHNTNKCFIIPSLLFSLLFLLPSSFFLLLRFRKCSTPPPLFEWLFLLVLWLLWTVAHTIGGVRIYLINAAQLCTSKLRRLMVYQVLFSVGCTSFIRFIQCGIGIGIIC